MGDVPVAAPASASTTATRSRHGRSRIDRQAVAVGLLCLILTGVLALVVTHERGISGDEPFYVAIARHPAGPHSFPYAYRLAVPWLVHALPFSEVVSFTIIGLVCVGWASGALYALLSEFGVGGRVTTGLVLGFALSPTLWVVVIRHFRSIDPASVLVMVLGTLFIVRRRRLALLLTLTIGVAVRESTLFLIPLAYAMWATEPIDRRALRDVAATCLLPAVLYVVIRTQVGAVGERYIPGYSGPFLHARVDFLEHAQWGTELRRLAYTYGPIWVVAPPALRSSGFARRGLTLVVLCAASMTYAYDWGRIMFLAAPVFFVAAGQVVGDRRRLALATVLALLVLDIGYGVYLQVHGVQSGLDTTAQRIPVF